MKQLFIIVILACAYGGMPALAGPGAHWEEVRDADGIKVFVVRTADDPIVIVRTEVVIDASLERLTKLLDDEAGRVRWVPYLLESSVVHTFASGEKLLYNRFAAPWPAADRDFVFRVTKVRADDNSVTYSMKSEPSPLLPERGRIVRARLMESSYALTAMSDHQTRVDLIFHADPRGWLPLWIVNIIQRVFPYKVLKNLREQVGG